MLKYLLLFLALPAFGGIPYLTEPTNNRVDGYVPSATGPNQKWVPQGAGGGGVTNSDGSFNNYWKTNSVSGGGIINTYTNPVTVNGGLSSGSPAVPIVIGGSNFFYFNGVSGINDPFGQLNIYGGILGVAFYGTNNDRAYTIGLKQTDNFLRNDYFKVLPTTDYMLGAQAGAMLENNGGSGSALGDLPVHNVWPNQPLPVIGVRVGNNSNPANPPSTTGLQCSTTNINLVLSNLSTFGILSITNQGIRPTIYFDVGYLAAHRGADGNLTNRSDIIPEVGNSGITNLFRAIHTNNAEVWVTGYFDPAPLTNGNTEADGLTTGGGYFQYPNQSNPNGSAYIHPFTTPQQVRTDMRLYGSWGADGIVPQDGGYVSQVGAEKQRFRLYASAIQYPRSATFETYAPVIIQSYFNHPMTITHFHNVPHFPEVSYEANGVCLDNFTQGWPFNDGVNPVNESGISKGVAFMRTYYQLLHTAPPNSIHPTWLFGNTAPPNTLWDFEGYFATAAISHGNVFAQQDISTYALDWLDFAASVTNGGWRYVMTNVAGPLNLFLDGGTNSGWSSPLNIPNTKAVLLANESKTTATNLTVTAGMLGFASNQLFTVYEVWGGLTVFTNVINSYVVSVPASNHVFDICVQIPSTIGFTNLVQSIASGLWTTNTVDGGIWWSNQNGNAKFGPLNDGTFVTGYTNNGGVLKADAKGATVFGEAFGASGLIYANGEGSLAGGESQSGATITTVELGSMAFGHANGANSLIKSISPGSFTFGNATTGGILQGGDVGDTGLTFGDVAGGASIKTTGPGAVAFGQASGNSGATILSGANGTFAHGDAANGRIEASSIGSMVSGSAQNGGYIWAGAPGAHVFGEITGTNTGTPTFTEPTVAADITANGGLYTFGVGSLISGYANSNATIVVGMDVGGTDLYAGVGSTALGFATGKSRIGTAGPASFAGGIATNGSWLTAQGAATFTYGQNISNNADFATAFGRDFTNRTAETFNVGWGSNTLQVASGSVTVSGSTTNTGNIQSATLNTTGASGFGGAMTFGSSGTVDGPTDSQVFGGTTVQFLGYGRFQGGVLGLGGSKGGANLGMLFNSASAQNRIVVSTNAFIGWSGLGGGGSSSFTNITYLEQGVAGTVIVDTNLIAKSTITATNGFTSYTNALTINSFTFPNTTVNWTNPVHVAIEVYIDNSAVTGTAIKKNGTTIFSGLSSDVTIGLRDGEYFSETYTVGTPVGTWSVYP